MLKKILLFALAICFPLLLSAQLTYGTTGLLHAPSAEMQRDKTVMIGGNFLNKEITPPTWYYHTYNYFLNVTIFPWLEVAYTCTLFKAEALGLEPYGYSGFTNQDRYFSFRLRLLKEGQFWKYMPAVVVGTSDPYTESGDGQISSTEGNGYFCRFYVAATKFIPVGKKEQIGVHLSWLFNHRLAQWPGSRSDMEPVVPPAVEGNCRIRRERRRSGCHLFAFQPFARAGRIAKNEVLYRRSYL